MSTRTLDFEIRGDAYAKTLLFLIHGYPDGPSVWDKSINNFLRDDCLCVNIALPGFERDINHRRRWFQGSATSWTANAPLSCFSERFFGPNFEQTVKLVEHTIRKVSLEHPGKLRMVMAHDYGRGFLYVTCCI